jgi:hypothetical protein
VRLCGQNLIAEPPAKPAPKVDIISAPCWQACRRRPHTSKQSESDRAPKNFPLSFFPKLWSNSPHPDSVRGADASSRTRGGMRWTRMMSRDERHSLADGEAVWSRRPDAGAKPLESYERGDGDNNARSHRGDHGISRKAIAQGMPECFGEPVVTNSCALFYRARGRGCIKHPAFPAPSLYQGDVWQNSDAIASRECGSVSAV